jgi:hypothetical protein
VALLSLKRAAIAFVLGGVALYAGSQYWLATRNLVPLDIPISLSRGHITTPEFSINLDAVYYIDIGVPRTPSIGNLECLMWGCDKTPAILKVQWTLSSAGHVELSVSSDYMSGSTDSMGTVGRMVGGFRTDNGRHRLDIDVLSDLSMLNEGKPRLKVQAGGDAYRRLGALHNDLPILSGMLASIGVVLLWLSTRERKVAQSIDLSIFAGPGSGQRGAGHLRKFPRGVLFSGLPSFALIMASVLLLVSVPVWNTEIWRYARGIWVLTSAQGRLTPRYGQGSKPLTLRIDKQRHWFLEGQPVTPEEFPAALRQALNRRPDRFVCLDADPALDLAVPGQAMDMLQGLFVKIIIATPKAVDDGCTATIGR